MKDVFAPPRLYFLQWQAGGVVRCVYGGSPSAAFTCSLTVRRWVYGLWMDVGSRRRLAFICNYANNWPLMLIFLFYFSIFMLFYNFLKQL